MQRFCTTWLLSAGVLLAPALGVANPAADFPNKPITIYVPFAPGAASDSLARVLAHDLATTFGQTVIVENKPGAGGALGPMLVTKAPPEGYTIGIAATGAIAVNPHIPDSAPLNVEELAPVAKLADIPFAFAAHPSAGYKDMSDFLKAAKSSSGNILVGNNGLNTAQHLSSELLGSMIGAKLEPVPYKGSAPAATALLGGEVKLAMVDLTSVYPHIKAGKLVGLGVTTAQRTKVAPDLPTLAEGGVPDYAAVGWLGLFAPAQTPPEIVQKLADAVHASLAKPEIEATIIGQASEPAFMGPAEFKEFVNSESAKWGKVIQGLDTKKAP